MTNLEQSIKKALPDLMELGVGQRIIVDKYITLTIDGNMLELMKSGTVYVKYPTIYGISPRNYEILGKPITLPDVLRWAKLPFKTDEETYFSYGLIQEKILELWDLTIPNLSDQSQPVKDFLSNLIPKDR